MCVFLSFCMDVNIIYVSARNYISDKIKQKKNKKYGDAFVNKH